MDFGKRSVVDLIQEFPDCGFEDLDPPDRGRQLPRDRR